MKITHNHIIEAIAFVVSLIYWKDIRKGHLKVLPFFLFFILCVELLGTYFKSVPYANTKLYNFSIPIEYFFYLLLFHLHGGALQRKYIVVAIIGFSCLTAYYFITLPIHVFHSKVLLCGTAMVVVASCIYLYEKFRSVEENSLLSDPFFWIATGLLLFNLEDFAYFFLYDMINLNNWDRYDQWFKAINNSLLILLYLSYIVAIVICHKNQSRHAK